MPIYVYKGYDARTGDGRKGKVEADSVKAARAKLRSKEKIIASELREEVAVTGGGGGSLFGGSGVSIQDLSIMTRQFATLQSAQVPLDECLIGLTQQVDNPVLRNTLSAVKDSVSEGRSLADSMAMFPRVFDRLYVNMVRAGEASGALGVVFERLADFQEYQVAVRGKVVSSMAYPMLMIFASLGIIAFLFISLVPKLQKVFASMKVKLPWYTELLIGFSEFLQKKWYVVLIAIAALVFLFRSWYQTEAGRRSWDAFVLGLPIFGAVAIRVNISKFTKTLETLLSSGVPIINALEITRNVIGNRIISDVVAEAKISVQEGEPLGMTIAKSDKFPPLVTQMIITGEKTGELETMLKHVSAAYDAEVERKIDSMISLIEPMMIIVLAGIVVVVVVAMLVPMFSIMNQMH